MLFMLTWSLFIVRLNGQQIFFKFLVSISYTESIAWYNLYKQKLFRVFNMGGHNGAIFFLNFVAE